MTGRTAQSSEMGRRRSEDNAVPGVLHWWGMLALGLGTLCLGWFGFSKYYSMHGQIHSFWHILYVSLQLFTIESGPVPGPTPIQLNVARFLAPVVPVWAVARTFVLVFGDRIRAIKRRRMRGHVVICGLGRRGMQLVRDFRDCGSRVLAIDCDPDNDNIRVCRDLGVPVLVGSATDPGLLKKARADRAEHVVAVCGDDGTNVDIAVLVYQLVSARSARIEGAVRCSVQVVDLRLATLLEQHRILAESEDRFVASIFNTYHTSARALLREHPLDCERIAPNDPRHVHLVIVGFGQMGESLALQAAKIGCFANGRKIAITVIDLVAETRERQFLGEHPELGRVADVTFVEGDAEDPAILNRLRGWADDPEALTTVAVCLDDDSRGLSCALGVLSRLEDHGAPILVRMSDEVGLATLLEGEHGDRGWASHVHAFGTVSSTCTREALLREELDALARAIHEDYVAQRLAEGRSPDDASMRPWERLDEGFRNSSRASADHIPVKLRAVGCSVAAEGDETMRVETFTPDEVELMGRMEHARWCSERLLKGWLPGRRDPEAKKTPYLVEWDELSADVKKYDYDIVEGIPRFLESVGLGVYRHGK